MDEQTPEAFVPNQFRLTISMSVYDRPIRTIRAINSILNQDTHGWQALITGDGCDKMEQFMRSDTLNEFKSRAEANGNSLVFTNIFPHRGGWGYHVTNANREMAQGRYFCFLDNDDTLEPGHVRHYLSEIENTNLDFVYYNTLLVNESRAVRSPQLAFCAIGHSELIIRTDFLRHMPPHKPEYGHDWQLIEAMMQAGGRHKKAESKLTTYHVMSTGANRETE